jgi:hypothetical protein
MSKINVNQVDTQCGSTLTLGSSGKTVTLASGASQSGFGRTGTVDWCTTAKTSPLTVVSGNGYFINTTGGAITVTLPSSPSAGDIVSLKDYANTWDTNAVTIGRNGSKINGVCGCGTLNTESQSVTLIYVDGTKGWQDIQDSTSNVSGADFITATGGTITTVCTNYKVHTFTSDGTFCVSAGGGPKAVVSYMVIAGGAGGATGGGGGGAGGFREGKANTPSNPDSYTASPIAATTGIELSPGPYSITVGGGGAAGPSSSPSTGAAGSVSTFSTITSAGGGGGGKNVSGVDGGSGGGTSGVPGVGSGNTPPVSPPQGNDGGTTGPEGQGGGGGSTAVGGNGSAPAAGAGGAGATSSINATPTARAGGGGGGGSNAVAGGTASAGGGAGGAGPGPGGPGTATAGTANTGGGGGGGGIGGPGSGAGGDGGSGIVIIRYKFQ